MKPDAIERTVQKTNVWLHDICEALRIKDERIVYRALRAVLHAIRDRPGQEAVGTGSGETCSGSASVIAKNDHVEARWLELENRMRTVGDKADDALRALRTLVQEIRSAYQGLRQRIAERPAK
jgi:hypothetical protein